MKVSALTSTITSSSSSFTVSRPLFLLYSELFPKRRKIFVFCFAAMMLSTVLSIIPVEAQQQPQQPQQTTKTTTATTRSTDTTTSSNTNTMMSSEASSSSTSTTTSVNEEDNDDATSKTNLPELTHELVTEILQYKGIYTDPEEEEVCRRLISGLNEKDLETAAHSSYAFWWYVTTQPNPEQTCESDVQELRFAAAQREARRHYVGNHREYDKALSSLRKAIELRRKYHVDLLRWMGVPDDQRPPLDESEKERLVLYRRYISDEMDRQMTAVVGLDEAQRAMILKGSRTNRDTNIEGYLMTQIYAAERAMALTEVASRGRQERIFVVFDFAGYISQHAPPTLQLRGALQDLQALYKERLHQLVILDPPFFLNLIYNIVAPFLDNITREKIVMVSGPAERLRVVTGSPERKAALSCLLSQQKEEKGYGVNVKAFLQEISFHQYYNLATPPLAALS